jgi:ADP-heptose:LPS heptosyltransferase
MFPHLYIDEPRERALVAAADAGLRLLAPAVRAFRPSSVIPPRRILLMRIERIGDLLMTLDGIADVISAAPHAQIDLVVGSWNVDVARAIPGIHRVETLDAAWLVRDGSGQRLRPLMARARSWRNRRYDLAINFEPDIRSHLLMAAIRPARTAGFSSGGGGPLLDVSLPFDRTAHTSDNARRLAAATLDIPTRTGPARLDLPPAAMDRASALLNGARRPLVGVHASGGREIKQWPPERFGEVAARVARERGATIVLTGGAADRPLVDIARRAVGSYPVIDLAGSLDLLTLGAVLEQLDVYVTGDTGPMHLASAVGTPIVAVFGPSNPVRYAPRSERHRIVRIDLPCSPCNRIRVPPARCVGHTPDCLAGIDAETVFHAVLDLLDARGTSAPGTSHMAHGTSHVAHGTSHMACGASHVAHGTSHIARGTSHIARCTLHVARGTLHVARGTSHIARGTLHVARGTSHIARGTSHMARGTSHMACGASHVARGTSHIARGTLLPCL